MDNVNMLLQSQKFENISDFLRGRDNREAIASFIIDEGHRSTFFANMPNVMHQEFNLEQTIGDVVKIRHWNMTIGNGVPGPAKSGRQLAGNEALNTTAWRETSLMFGVHRYAVALENIVDKKILPEAIVSFILGSPQKWWAFQDDMDSFMTLFRDYPHYCAELDGLTGTEVSERVYPLFGRGYNDVATLVDTIYAGDGTKQDIEPGATVTGFRSLAVGDKKGLADTDTLTSTFIDNLSQYIGNQLKMPAISIEGEKPFFGMIVAQRDISLMFINSASTLVSDLKSIAALPKVATDTIKSFPIFSRELGELFSIKFMMYGQVDKTDDPLKQAPHTIKQFTNTIYEDLEGTAIKPEAKILAAAKTGDSVTGLTLWTGGYLTSGLTRGVSAVANTYQLFVSSGARFFPYYDGTIIGSDSINNIDVGLYGGGASTSTYYGRLQIGQGNTATTRYKVVYTGPIYSGSIKIGNNLGLNTFVEDAYKLEIKSLHAWNSGTGSFAATNLLNTGTPATDATNWATFKAFVGINATTKAIDPALMTRALQFNRRVHMFDTVRTMVFGKQLLYKLNGKGAEFAMEQRDYGAFTGSGLNVIQGKKIVQSGHGLANNYAIVCFKRPPATI